ncbi:tripartite tricarboxylate transporter TctB family protein [Salinicola corii]|uniref:Tripartite tricarboxylate transporter TctB family protein n=1 Tax=Salinicola corii TaxID=2606937 RepID=A0A640WH83_9GAMM|nr:tripartite tricarboxylate transporter TctB family protein [Salinicola corii]KAA0019712.1 tripartite tricarboxylate transporter TctB family protein [Salinicola corii]
MNVSRLLLGVFGIVVAGVFFLDASQYPRAAAQMPMIYAVSVGLLSLAMVASELRLQRRAPATRGTVAEPVDREADEASLAPRRWAAVAAIFLLAVGYVAVMTTLGYVLATALFMALALAILGTVKWAFALIAGAVLIGMVCLVFVQFLGLPIPLLPNFL